MKVAIPRRQLVTVIDPLTGATLLQFETVTRAILLFPGLRVDYRPLPKKC